MAFTLKFIKVITQVAVVATVTFIAPALLHAAIMLNFNHYFMDIMSADYRFGMTFCTVVITIFYIIVYSMELEERAERKRLGLNQNLKY
jgi:uncharacterized membrane protein